MPTYINLSPGESPNRINIFVHWLSQKGKYIVLTFNILLFGMYLYNLNLERQNIVATTDINYLLTEIKNLESDVMTYNDFQKTVEVINTEMESDVDSNFILDLLRDSTPSGIKISSISSDGSKIVITAISANSVIFSSFIDLLTSVPRITSVIMTSSTYNEDANSFSSTFEISY